MNQLNYISWRFYLVLILILVFACGLLWRVFDLCILDQGYLRHQGDERTLRLIKTPAFRGMITDRNGFPLAVSTPVYSVWMNPSLVDSENKNFASLSTLLEMKPKKVAMLIHGKTLKSKKRHFIYLKRGLSPEIAQQIKELNIPGIYTQVEYRRYYPEGEACAHVVGLTNIDDHGQEGLELFYNDWLAGEPGKKWVIKDRLGEVISDVGVVQNQKKGHDLVLSIDRRIQYLSYRELLAGLAQNQANIGTVIVLDVKTGEVLAMVNAPSFNPNKRLTRISENLRNRAVTDTFEPGSTIKAFTVASALASGRFTADSIIDTSPGWMRVDHNVVKDEKNNGPLSMTQILQISSNMGAAKLVLSLPPNQLWEMLHQFGFGQITGIGFPGEQDGVLVKHEHWGNFVLATLSFGYGLSMTPLQLARAYAILANHGTKLPLSLLRVDTPPRGEPTLDANLAKEMLILLESVVATKHGTARTAYVPGYRVAGKTGTSKIAGPHGYLTHRYIASFVGIAPLTDPRLVVAVIIRDPQGPYYHGGEVAAPIFEKIMEGALRILNVPPEPSSVLDVPVLRDNKG